MLSGKSRRRMGMDASVLKLEELWSFVMKKTKQAWIWIALCRKTHLAFALKQMQHDHLGSM